MICNIQKPNNSGFSLIELLVVVGMMSIIGLGIMTLISNSHKDTALIEERLGILDLHKALTTLTMGKNICESSFTGNQALFTYPLSTFPPVPPAPDIELTKILSDTTPIAEVANRQNTIAGLWVEKIKLLNLRSANPGNTLYTADLVISFTNETNPNHIKRKPIATKVILSGTIVGTNIVLNSCITEPPNGTPSTHTACEAVGGSWVVPVDTTRPQFCTLSADIIEWY